MGELSDAIGFFKSTFPGIILDLSDQINLQEKWYDDIWSPYKTFGVYILLDEKFYAYRRNAQRYQMLIRPISRQATPMPPRIAAISSRSPHRPALDRPCGP